MSPRRSLFADLSDDQLIAEVKRLAAIERRATAMLIRALMELDARRLYLGEGYSSLFTYCMQALYLAEGAAIHLYWRQLSNTSEVRMRRWLFLGWIFIVTLTTARPVLAQADLAKALAELTALSSKVGSADTRTRVDAMHRVRLIALSRADVDVKLKALELLRQPVGSSSDHIRIPAVYAIAEIANSSADAKVKLTAVKAFAEPLDSSQGEIRNATIDALNSITRNPADAGLASAAVAVLEAPMRSGVNGVRMPAINALMQAVVGKLNSAASQQAMELLKEPLNSSAGIGGMEVRMMAVAAMEKIGMDVSDIQAKAKAMGLLMTYADKSSWEPEAKARARAAADRVQATISK